MTFKKSVLFALMLIFLILAACTKETSDEKDDQDDSDNVNTEGMPIVDDEIDIEMFAVEQEDPRDWNDIYVWNEYEDMTNVNVEWEQAPGDAAEEKRNLALSGGDMPDAFFISSIPNLDIFKYGEQGKFLPLNDLIDEYAPNLKELMDEYPEIEKAITFPDGNIYSLPSLVSPDFKSFQVSSRPYINEEWLDDVDMETPETTEEFYQYLKAVKKEDPLGDGETVPYGGTDIDDLIGYLKGSFGVGNKGVRNSNIDADPDNDDKVRFFPTSDDYKEMLEYLNKLYDEELIEENIFTIEWDQYLANASDGEYGSTVFYDPVELFGEEAGEPFDSGEALEGPDGDKEFIKVAPMVASISNFVITSENEHPEATVRWLDYFYSDEGTKFFYMGEEGETHEETEDGEYEYIDDIKDNPDGLTLEQAAADYFAWIGGFVGMVKEDYYHGSESTEGSIEASEKLEPYIPDELWPEFTYTEEENKVLNSTGSDIDKYVEEMRDKFINGSASFSEWDDYVEKIEKMGLDEYMDIQQDALDRYREN